MTGPAIAPTLAGAAWLADPALGAVAQALGAADGLTRLVGGAVRDTLLGQSVQDIDLATRLLPDEVMQRLAQAGIKAVPTGLAHGTVTAVADGRPFEVTTLRRDVETDGRRATIAYTDDWAEDAARRDFTINALYADPLTGMVFDPVGGLADLAARRVRFIGDAAQRIDEDHLRILRWFRFTARFGAFDGPDDDGALAATSALIAAKAPLMRALSRERIADELLRILRLLDPVPALEHMQRLGIMAEIATEIDPGAPQAVARMIARETQAGLPLDPVRRLIALLPADAVRADAAAARLRLSNKVRRRIVTACQGGADGAVRALAWRIGVDGARDRWLLSDRDCAELAQLQGWTPPRLPVGGRDVMERGIDSGPQVAAALRRVEDVWMAADFPDRAATLKLLDGVLDRLAD